MQMLLNSEVRFIVLKKKLNTSDGNLMSHLRRLETTGAISYRKAFVGRQPATYYSATDKGRAAFMKLLTTRLSIAKFIK